MQLISGQHGARSRFQAEAFHHTLHSLPGQEGKGCSQFLYQLSVSIVMLCNTELQNGWHKTTFTSVQKSASWLG